MKSFTSTTHTVINIDENLVLLSVVFKQQCSSLTCFFCQCSVTTNYFSTVTTESILSFICMKSINACFCFFAFIFFFPDLRPKSLMVCCSTTAASMKNMTSSPWRSLMNRYSLPSLQVQPLLKFSLIHSLASFKILNLFFHHFVFFFRRDKNDGIAVCCWWSQWWAVARGGGALLQQGTIHVKEAWM